METRGHYVAVGAFVLTMVVLGFAAVLWLGRAELSTQYAHYDIYFRGPVTGLRPGASVEYSGVPVGKVTDVRIDPNDVERIRVTVEVDNSVVIKDDARASVETNILSGVSYIQIVGGTQGAHPLEANEGERYPVIRSHRSRLASVTARLPELLEKLNDTADKLNDVLGKKNREALAASLDNIHTFAQGLASRNQDIAEFTENAKKATASLADLIEAVNKSYSGPDGLGKKAATAIDDFDRLAKNLNETSRQLQSTLQDVRPGVRDFSKQTLGDIAALVADSRQLVARLGRLTDEIARNPSLVLYGDRREGYRPR